MKDGRQMTAWRVRALALTLTLMTSLLPTPALAAKKTDVLVLVNGDHLTGEVKELSYGQLTFKTDHLGTVYIEWDKIVSLTTTQVLQVELADGRRYFGTAPEVASQRATLRLLSGAVGAMPEPIELPMSEIVRVATTIEGQPFYKRLDGSVSAGYSFTRASDVKVATLSAEVESSNRVRRWDVSFDGQLTSQEAAATSQRASLIGSFERFMADRYYREISLEFTRNEELGLDLRSLVGMTFGRYLVQTQGKEWRAGVGLAASTETGSDGVKRQSIEGQLTTSLRLFRLDTPKTDVNATFTILPGLSDWGRLRGESSIKARHEIIHDLFFELSLNDSYDNRPSEGAKTNDWNLATSLGYSF
jgi:hypothetical protein